MKYKTDPLWEYLQVSTQHCAVVGLLLLSMTAWAPVQADPQIAKRALAATVLLEVADSTGQPLSLGSGFFVDNNLIATNFHVIKGAAQGTAKLVGGTTKYTIEGFMADDENDLAILKVTLRASQPPLDIQPLSLGDSDTVKIGETVYVAGNPIGLEGTFTKGVISGVGRRSELGSTRFQMDAAISPGSSGGPVLNGKSEVIGVSVAYRKGGQNLNFAVPSDSLKALLKQDGPTEPLLSQENLSIAPATYYSWGISKMNYKEYKEAIKDYNQAIRKYDYFYQENSDLFAFPFAEAYSARGHTKYLLAQYDAAIEDYNQAMRIYEQASRFNLNPNPKIVSWMASLYHSRGCAKYSLAHYDAAIEDYNQAIQRNPDFAEAYHARGRAKYSLAHYDAAIEDYNQTIQRNQRREESDRKAATALKDSKDYNQAIQLIAEKYYYPYYARGRAKYSLAHYDAAIEDYNQTIQRNPDFAEAYYSRGNAKYSIEEYKEAIADYDKAIRLNPNFVKAYHGRYAAKLRLGNWSIFDSSDQSDAVWSLKSLHSILPPLPPE